MKRLNFLRKAIFKAILFSSLIVFTTQLVAQPMSGVYTVDTNLISSATNFTSLAAMSNSLHLHGVNGPTVINIHNSLPNEPLYIKNIPGASTTNSILIDGNDSSKTIIEHN